MSVFGLSVVSVPDILLSGYINLIIKISRTVCTEDQSVELLISIRDIGTQNKENVLPSFGVDLNPQFQCPDLEYKTHIAWCDRIDWYIRQSAFHRIS
jgi:hypothetical protein